MRAGLTPRAVRENSTGFIIASQARPQASETLEFAPKSPLLRRRPTNATSPVKERNKPEGSGTACIEPMALD